MRHYLIAAVLVCIGFGFGARVMTVGATDVEVIKVVAVRHGDLLSAVTASGTLQPARVADIRYDAQDLVVRLLVKEGDLVRPGQVVAEMDTRVLRLARNQAAQSARKDATLLATARAAAHRSDALAARGLIATVDREEAHAALDAAEAQVAADEEAMQQIDERISRAVLRSPMHGTVLRVYVHAGEMLGSAAAVASLGLDAGGAAKPTNTIMTLASADGLLMYANVNAADLRSVRIGQHVDVAIDGFTAATTTGKVSAIDLQPTVANNVTSYRTAVRLTGTDAQLRMGLPATALFRTVLAVGAQLVPSSAVTNASGHHGSVIVLEHCSEAVGCAAVTRTVRQLARNSTTSAIEGAFGPGDLIAIDGCPPSSSTFRTEVTSFEPNTEATLLASESPAPSKTQGMRLSPPPPARHWLARMMGL